MIGRNWTEKENPNNGEIGKPLETCGGGIKDNFSEIGGRPRTGSESRGKEKIKAGQGTDRNEARPRGNALQGRRRKLNHTPESPPRWGKEVY